MVKSVVIDCDTGEATEVTLAGADLRALKDGQAEAQAEEAAQADRLTQRAADQALLRDTNLTVQQRLSAAARLLGGG